MYPGVTANMLLALVMTCAFILALRPVAHRFGLLDIPQGHKTHSQHTPLVGGIAIYTSLAILVLLAESGVAALEGLRPFAWLVLFSGALVLSGAIDDYRHLSVAVRFPIQIAVATGLCLATGTQINDLGYLLYDGVFVLGIAALPFTVFAMVGAINALNMTDGLDGLAGSLVLITLLALAAIAGLGGDTQSLTFLLTLAAAVTGFLLFNARLPGRHHAHVFLGDAGSMMLGLVICYFLVTFSQGENRLMSPVTALWVFAMPLLDTFGVMIRRKQAGRPVWEPARDHLHHRLLRRGFTIGQTVAIIAALQCLLSGMGVVGNYYSLPDYLLFYGWITLFVIANYGPRYWRRPMSNTKFGQTLDS
ncbi:MAG: undecaprenyl/decaprenyl-phosphate alpha-N-acetylglucosaminyl 1-phosphate transferase [Gammaproteobacteria bacterium]|nr:undecaprenyl/decaprenyl-phosphate alpha-N-acetylglucosaminyl 1-phosphate transferase [Gammaproteobacteria bacterium]